MTGHAVRATGRPVPSAGVGAAPGGVRATGVRATPALTARDRAQLAALGRPTVLRRLRIRATVAWSAATSTVVVGMTMLAVRPVEDDTGILLTLSSVPLLLVAAHHTGRLQRVQGNDPDRPPPITPAGTRVPPAEVADLADVRHRLLAVLPALDLVAPEVAEEVRAADRAAHPALARQGEALAALDALPVADDPATRAARTEIRAHVQSGIVQYQQLLAESVLLVARAGTIEDVAPLEQARELVASHSEGLRIATSTSGSDNC